jgi:protein-S-isoprenylcysteine O-methyltransferase Ste14
MRFMFWIDVTIFLGFGVFVLSHWEWNVRYLIGIAMAVVGFPLWMLARVQLGGSFSIRAEAKRLVTTGLYSKFRHPIYLFGGIAFLGLFIALGLPIALLCFLLLYSRQLFRIRREERVLEEAFGEEYRRYKTVTWF